MLNSSSARVIPLGTFKVVMSMTDDDMLPVKLGKIKYVTTLEYLLSLELNLMSMLGVAVEHVLLMPVMGISLRLRFNFSSCTKASVI